MEPDLSQFPQLGPEYRHVKDFVTTAPPPGGYVVKASKDGQTAPGYNPYGGNLNIVVDPHLASRFEFTIPAATNKREELDTMVKQSDIDHFPDTETKEKVVNTLRTFSHTTPAPAINANHNISSPPPINREAPKQAAPEVESVVPLVETELSFAGSPFSTEAAFSDVFEDETKKWLFLVYYNGTKAVSRTKIAPTNLVLELKIKGRDIGYKLDVKEPIIVEFKDFSFIILKIIDAVVV